MQPGEMAQRLRHDLIKHLDIPEAGQTLGADDARVLLRRVFDTATGLCRQAENWAFRFRRDPDWVPSLDPALRDVERAARDIAAREKQWKRTLHDGGTVDAETAQLLARAAETVRAFERACDECDAPDDADDALAFFGFGDFPDAPTPPSPTQSDGEPSPTPSPARGRENVGLRSTPSERKRNAASGAHDDDITASAGTPDSAPQADDARLRVLVVDDHLMSIDRLQAHGTFQKRFDWITLCDRTCECRTCPEREHCEKRRARTYAEVLRALGKARDANRPADALLMDVRFDDLASDELLWIPDMPDLNREANVKALQGLIIAREIRRTPGLGHIPIVLMTALSRLPQGADRLLAGLEGLQFVDDDDSLETLATRVESVVRVGREAPVEFGYFWGSAPQMQAVRRQIEIMSLGPRTVFLTGPSGAGKSSLVEHVIYPLSHRRCLVTLDLSSVPDSLVESELFGHVKGAYSGATHDRTGLIEEADGGILFLDEIGNLSPENQRRLLLFLQDKMVRRVGASHETRRRVDVKVVVATHLDLAEEVAAGRFRFDLYMRFSPAMRITLPALADRRDDMPAFVETLATRIVRSEDMRPHIEEITRRSGARGDVAIDFGAGARPAPQSLCIRFKPATRDLFLAYSWPGNTRELESVLDTLILKALYDLRVSGSQSRIVEIDHYYAMSLLGTISTASAPRVTPDAIAADAPWDIGPQADFPELRRTLETRYLRQVFDACRGDVARMGEMLFGDAGMQHKIAVRLNQLGLSVRKLRKG